MKILKDSFFELFPEKEPHTFEVTYSGKFRGYNANIKRKGTHICVSLSKNWKGVSPEIQKGLVQELLVRLYKKKTHTIHMDLYHNFLRNLSDVAPKTQTHPILEESFRRVNEKFFFGAMEQPNLRLSNGTRRVGTYEYATNTVTLSEILLENETLLDYVMYHELLHKKHQYTAKNGRARHHSTEFRRDEKKFPNAELLEKELVKLARKQKWSFW
jgi:hypothetical protein